MNNRRRMESVGVQLHHMEFKSAPSLNYGTLTKNGQEIYDRAVERLGLPKE